MTRSLKAITLRISLILICVYSTSTYISAQDAGNTAATDGEAGPNLDRNEVRSDPVRFINRTNRRASEQMRNQDTATGVGIAKKILDSNEAETGGVTVTRVFDGNKEGLGADIMTISDKANFGHINRVKRILIGYLMEAFEYNEADAEVISRFILYYNARHRGDLDKVKEKYSEAVVSALDPARVGIDRSYQNWAGKTQLLLPLSKNVVRPGDADVNRDEIQDETSDVEDGQRDELEDVDNRRDEEDSGRLDDKQQELEDEQSRIQDEQNQIDEQQQEVEQQIEDTGKRLQELEKDPERNAEEIEQVKEEQQDLQNQQEELQKQEEDLQQQEEANQQEQQEVADQQQDIANEQAEESGQQDVATTDTTTETTQDTNTNATEDQNEAVEEQPADEAENVVQDKILFLRVLRYENGGHYSNELWAIDAAQGDALFRSPFTQICSRDLLTLKDAGKIIVIGYTGTDHDPNKHYLVSIDAETLEQVARTEEVVFWRSEMVQSQDGKVYAFESRDGQYFLTRWDSSLKFDARSSAAVSPNSTITIYKDRIYLTGQPREGQPTNIQIFNREDLKLITTIDSNRLDEVAREQ